MAQVKAKPDDQWTVEPDDQWVVEPTTPVVDPALAAQRKKYPTAAEHEEDLQKRSGHDVAIDQIKNMAGGVADLVTGIPGALHDLGQNFNPNPAPGGPSVADKASSLYHSVADPVGTSLRSIGNYFAPHTVAPPTDAALEGAARGGAGVVASLALPKAIGAASGALPEESALQNLAVKARSYREATPIGSALEKTANVLKPGTAIKSGAQVVGSATAGAVAPLLEKLAAMRAGKGSVLPAPGQTFQQAIAEDEASRIRQAGNQDVTPGPDAMHPAGATPVAVPYPHNAVNDEFLARLRDQETPEEQYARTVAQRNQEFTPDPNAVQTPIAQPLPQSDPMQQFQPEPHNVEFKQPAGPPAPIPASGLQTLADQMSQPAPTMEHPIQPLSPDEEGILKGIFRQGKGAAASVKNMNLAIQNAPYLLKTIPELQGIPPGQQFDARLFNGFQWIGHELKAAEASIPDTTPVATTSAVKQLKATEQEAAASMQNDSVRAIAKVRSKLEQRPTMTWDDFVKAKRSFDDEVGVDSAIGSKIYQVFKEMSNSVSPELGKLNQQYYTARTAIDLAKMHTYKGLRLAEVAQKAKGLRP